MDKNEHTNWYPLILRHGHLPALQISETPKRDLLRRKKRKKRRLRFAESRNFKEACQDEDVSKNAPKLIVEIVYNNISSLWTASCIGMIITVCGKSRKQVFSEKDSRGYQHSRFLVIHLEGKE